MKTCLGDSDETTISDVRSHSCQWSPSEFVPSWLAKWGMVTCFTSDVSSPDIVELEKVPDT